MAEFVRVAHVDEIPPGTAKELTVAGRVLALYHVDGQFYVLDGICPHAGGPLGNGELQGNVVTCPWHGWQFDVTTGRHCLTPNIQQPVFPVKVEEREVFVDLSEAS